MLDRRLFLKLFNIYPPYLGAGVRVRFDSDNTIYYVSMKLRWYNNNYVGVHFGGSLYSMVDPFYMLILMHKLGPGYIVWDKAAKIEFRRPGRGKVHARFEVPDEEIQRVKERVEAQGKDEPIYVVEILNEQNEVVARVEKTLWVKRRS